MSDASSLTFYVDDSVYKNLLHQLHSSLREPSRKEIIAIFFQYCGIGFGPHFLQLADMLYNTNRDTTRIGPLYLQQSILSSDVQLFPG